MDAPREFNPQDHTILLKNKQYLEVTWRLVWLREEHPDAVIRQELVDHDKKAMWALFKTAVEIPGGGSAEAYGSESAQDFGDYIEKAATKSLGRALATLGYGTTFSAYEFGGEGDANRPVDAPLAPNFQQTPAAPQRQVAQQQPRQLPQRNVAQQQAQHPPQQGARAVQNPTADATDGQKAFIGDLLLNNGYDPDVFDFKGLKRGEASQWIESLKNGVLPDFATDPNA